MKLIYERKIDKLEKICKGIFTKTHKRWTIYAMRDRFKWI